MGSCTIMCPTDMRTQKEWVVIPTPCMPIMHIQTDSKVPVLKKSSIPVDDMNIVVPVRKFKIESHSD